MWEAILVWTATNPWWTHMIVCAGFIMLIALWERDSSQKIDNVLSIAFIVTGITQFIKLIMFTTPASGSIPITTWSHWWITIFSVAGIVIQFIVVYRCELTDIVVDKFHDLKDWLYKFELIHWFMR